MDSLTVKQQQKSDMIRKYPGLVLKKKKLYPKIIGILCAAVLLAGIAALAVLSVHRSAVAGGTQTMPGYAQFESIYRRAMAVFAFFGEKHAAVSLFLFALSFTLIAGGLVILTTVFSVRRFNAMVEKSNREIEAKDIRPAYHALCNEIANMISARRKQLDREQHTDEDFKEKK